MSFVVSMVLRVADTAASFPARTPIAYEEIILSRSVVPKRKRSPPSRPVKALGAATVSPSLPQTVPALLEEHTPNTPMQASGFDTAGYASEFALTQSQELIDARREAQIWTTYALNPYLRANAIEVTVQNGKAVLRGEVEDHVCSELAEQIALRVAGVSAVHNRLRIAPCELPHDRSVGLSYGNMVEDTTVTVMVRAKIAWSRHAAGLVTKVETTRGRVTLSGTAACAHSKAFAGRLALLTRGVKAVNNRLAVKAARAGDRAEAFSDASELLDDVADSRITARIKSTLRYSSKTDGAGISVSTKAGVVTLRGRTAPGAARALAVELAGNVRGVKRVDAQALVP
jgi:hyperosmotically inducible periplasmic protein